MKLYKKSENFKKKEIIDLKIRLKIFNRNNKVYKNKIIPLKTLVNIDSSSRQ